MQKLASGSENGFLCYLRNLDKDTEGLVNDYWLTLSDDSENFFYSVDGVAGKYGISPAKVKRIVTNSCEFYFLTSEKSCCCCDGPVSVSGRKLYKEALEGAGLTCVECLENKKMTLEESCNEQLLSYLASSSKVEVYEYSDLNYLDKVFLLVLLSESYSGDGPLFFGAEGVSWSGFKSIDSEFFSSLVSKKAIKIVGSMGEKASLAYGRLKKERGYKNSVEIFGKAKEVPQPGFYFNLPKKFCSVNDFSLAVNDDVVKGNVSVDDIKNVKCLVNDVMVEKLYVLVKNVSLEYRISIKENIRLDAVLRYAAEMYPLDKIYYTMSVMSKNVIEYMHKGQVNKFACEHLFTSFLENYLSKVKAKNWELKYKKPLPRELESSNLEATVTAIFLSGCLNWNELSTAEITQRWLSGLNVIDAVS